MRIQIPLSTGTLHRVWGKLPERGPFEGLLKDVSRFPIRFVTVGTSGGKPLVAGWYRSVVGSQTRGRNTVIVWSSPVAKDLLIGMGSRLGLGTEVTSRLGVSGTLHNLWWAFFGVSLWLETGLLEVPT